MTVISLDAHRPKIAFKYERGDICRALRLALQDDNSQPAQDIEEVFFELVFSTEDNDGDDARELIINLLEAKG